MIRSSAMLVCVCAGCVFGVSMPGLAQTLTRPTSTPQVLDPNKPRERRKSDLPTGAQVHAKYIEATGGRAAYEKHEHCAMKARLEVPEAKVVIPLELSQAVGRKFSQKMELPDKTSVVIGSDGNLVWEVRSTGETSIYPPSEAASLLRANDFRHELTLAETYTLLECVGVETVDSKPAYKLLLVAPDGSASTRYYDKESGLLVKKLSTTKAEDKSVQVVTTLGDYKAVDGVMIPFAISTTSAGTVRNITLESLDFKQAIDPALFEPPAPVKDAIRLDREEREGTNRGKDGQVLPAAPAAPQTQSDPAVAPPAPKR